MPTHISPEGEGRGEVDAPPTKLIQVQIPTMKPKLSRKSCKLATEIDKAFTIRDDLRRIDN